jgi:hypothetical protein
MCLMRTGAIPDRRSTPRNKGASGSKPTFAGDDISAAKYYAFDKDFLVDLEPYSRHYEMCDR